MVGIVPSGCHLLHMVAIGRKLTWPRCSRPVKVAGTKRFLEQLSWPLMIGQVWQGGAPPTIPPTSLLLP